ncbi:hypothetical protein EJB05_14961, partial [Eragrostis curvula]
MMLLLDEELAGLSARMGLASAHAQLRWLRAFALLALPPLAQTSGPFFVLHKASTASSAPSSRGRRRADTSQPSSPNPKSTKRSRDVDAAEEDDSELYERLRLEAFHRTWSRIQSTIDEVLRGINLKLFDQVLQWVQESFSAIRAVAKLGHTEIQQPYPLLTDVVCRRIPTAFVLTKNAEFVDDITTFRDLAEHLECNGCHLAKLSATELSANYGVGGCLNLLRQLLLDVPDVADVSALASWYCYTENYERPIIIIIDDLEQCSGDVLGELVMTLSEWIVKIPIFFVMGIATTLDAPRKLLSSEALQRLESCKLTLGSPSDRMNALVQAILVKPCAGFCISYEVAVFLRNYFFRHDGTITSFISALKLACSKHFSIEPLSFLSAGMLEADCEEFWCEKFEALPESMLKYASGLPSCTSGKNSSNSSKNVAEGLSELLKVHKDWSAVLLCLYEAGRYDKVQFLDIFCEAVNPDLQTQTASNRDSFSRMTSENLSEVGFIERAMNTVRYLPMDTLSRVLDAWIILLNGMSEISDKLKELQSAIVGADSVRITKEKLTRRSTSSIGTGKVQTNDKAAVLLHDVKRCNLAQEYGDVINLHDWYIAFEGIINRTNSKAKRKSHSSPSKKKSKSTPPEGDAMIQARFCRAVTEMQITGLLRMPSKRRPDLVQRITFGP